MKKKLIPALFAVLFAGIAAVGIWCSYKSSIVRALDKNEPIYGLIVGTDYVDNARHSDTIIFSKYSPLDRKLDLLSIPRDTRVEIPKIRVRRINEVYAYAFKASKKNHKEACEMLWRGVQTVLFSSTESAPIPLHYYAEIDYEGFKGMINLLGGVDVSVENPMNYDDNWGKLHIHFATGTYHLNGQKALEYVRYRDSQGDYGRVGRQQEFLLKIIQRFTNPLNIVKLPRIVNLSLKSVQTNLSWYERLIALWEMKDMAREQIRLIQLPGKAQQGYWIPDPDGVVATANFLRGNSVLSVDSSTHPVSGDQKMGTVSEQSINFSKITVEVWNASSRKGLALEVMRTLREAGFDVVKWGNYSSRQQKTLVRDHRGDARAARAITEALKSPKSEVFTRVETNPLVDVEVILGEEYGNASR